MRSSNSAAAAERPLLRVDPSATPGDSGPLVRLLLKLLADERADCRPPAEAAAEGVKPLSAGK